MNILMHIPSDEFESLVTQYVADMSGSEAEDAPDSIDEAAWFIHRTMCDIIDEWIVPNVVPLDELIEDDDPWVSFIATLTKKLKARFPDANLIGLHMGTTPKTICVIFQSHEFKL